MTTARPTRRQRVTRRARWRTGEPPDPCSDLSVRNCHVTHQTADTRQATPAAPHALDRENHEALYAYAAFINEDAEYVLNELIDTVLAKDKDFVKWRAEHPAVVCATAAVASRIRRASGTVDRAAAARRGDRGAAVARAGARRAVARSGRDAARDRRARVLLAMVVAACADLGSAPLSGADRQSVPRVDSTRTAVRVPGAGVRVRDAVVHDTVSCLRRSSRPCSRSSSIAIRSTRARALPPYHTA